jgi:hypothetical protein
MQSKSFAIGAVQPGFCNPADQADEAMSHAMGLNQ